MSNKMYYYQEFEYPKEIILNPDKLENESYFDVLKELFVQIGLPTDHLDNSKTIRNNWYNTISLILKNNLWDHMILEEKICNIMIYNKFILNEFRKELFYNAISLIKINEVDNKKWILCKLNLTDNYYPDDFGTMTYISEVLGFEYKYTDEIMKEILNICNIYKINPNNVKLILNIINFEIHADNYPDFVFLFGEEEDPNKENTGRKLLKEELAELQRKFFKQEVSEEFFIKRKREIEAKLENKTLIGDGYAK